MERIDVLAVYAHPDDESWSCAGLFSRCAQRGLECRLVTATYGEAGFRPEVLARTPEDERKKTREDELREATRIAGVAGFEILGFPDGGLENCVSTLQEALVERIRRFRPRVVVTFDETGVTGHRDHMAVHAATTAAFSRAGAYESRLLYNILPERVNIAVGQAMGVADPSEGRNVFFLEKWEGPPPEKDGSAGAFCVPDERIAVVVDVRDHVEAKRAAILAHRSQLGESTFLSSLPRAVLEAFLGWEYFQLGAGAEYPEIPASDIFEGLPQDGA